MAYAIALPLFLILLCLIPLRIERSVMPAFSLLLITILCTLPFYFSGIALSAILTKYDVPIGKLYAADLLGAALGCLFVLGGLEIFSAPTLILLCALIGAIAAFVFAYKSPSFAYRRMLGLACAALVILVILNTTTSSGIHQLASKGNISSVDQVELERWNSFSRITVSKAVELPPQLWGPSPTRPTAKVVYQYPMLIDGDAATYVMRFRSPEDLESLRFDVTNIAYFLRPSGGACIIGLGGGRDLQSALLFGHEQVLGVDVNPTFIDLQKNKFQDFTGLANNDRVRMVVDEARSYLTHTDEKFSVLQMSMIDTWAATGAGAFSLSENGLYTVEAWKVFYDRLKDDGIFTVSRWYDPDDLGETGRILSLSVTALLENGVEDPSRHIALVTVGRVSTLLLSKQPFSQSDVEKLKQVTSEKEYDLVTAPGVESKDPMLRDIVNSRSSDELNSVIKAAVFNYEPSTDESPYFFNMLRLDHLDHAFRTHTGVVTGNLLATVVLGGLIFCLALLAVVTVIVPLRLRTRSDGADPGTRTALRMGGLYFCLIGSGFMFAEIAMIQKLSVYLGHPTYALGVLLFTIIASTGVGSFLSDRLPLTLHPYRAIFPIVTAVLIVSQKFVLSELVIRTITEPIFTKSVYCCLLIFPMGILLGFFFPVGMKVFRPLAEKDTPWFWALNGIFGVLCSAIAVFISIYFGISKNFYIAAICYALVLIPLLRTEREFAPVGSRNPDLGVSSGVP